MSAFEDFVNLELPRRSALLTVEITGYDGDPSNPSAPPVLTGAPKGTWYLRETPADTFYRKDSTGAWVEGGGGGAGGELDILYSLTPLTATVDYDDPAAVDPPVDTIFSSQQEMDDYLAAQSATTFKHLQKLWEALPVFVFHTIDITLSGTIHRPANDVTTYAFTLDGKYLLREGFITVVGAPPSSWTDVVAAQTVTSHQVASWDPWVRVAGTPFNGLDLKGLFAVLDTGQTGIIHDHDDNTLYLTQDLSPAPVDSSTTVRVCRPSTILQNSEDGITYKGTSGCVSVTCDAGVLAPVWFENVWFQAFGRTFGYNCSRSRATSRMLLCLFDHAEDFDTLGITEGRAYQASRVDFVYLDKVSFRSRVGINDQSPMFFADVINANMLYCFLRGHRRGAFVQDASQLVSQSSVWEDVGWQTYSGFLAFLAVTDGSTYIPQYISFFGGKRNTFRATVAHPGNAIDVRRCTDPFNAGASLGIWFEGFQAAVLLINGSDCDLRSSDGISYPGWQNDGGGNSDVGIEIVGAGQKVILGDGVDISGAAGDVRLEGTVGPYGDLGTEVSPLVTTKLNIVSKG